MACCNAGGAGHHALSPEPLKPDLAKRSAPAPIASEPRQSAADVAPDDGWTLPREVRATLPQKLHNAAERKLFTVDYSSGHARTLYVFSDPGCPNCQRLESSSIRSPTPSMWWCFLCR